MIDVMGFLSTVGQRFVDNPWVYLTMPFVAAAIGYVTKLAAIRMMFEPLEFIGVGRFGWQGIIPRRAAKMAAIAVETMTANVLDTRDLISRLDPERMASEIEGPLMEAIEQIIGEVGAEYQPGLYESLPEAARRLIVARVRHEAPRVISGILEEAKENIEDVFDLKYMVVSNLVRDKPLLNRMFREVGDKEFRFIISSGIWFGFIIGVVQAVTYLLVEQWWVLPLFGLIVGYATDWLALRLLFTPRQPRRILGVTVQGLFLKRQQEVARDYGSLIAKEILTSKNFFEALLRGPFSDRLFLLVQKHVQRVIDDQSSIARPLVVLAVGSRQYHEMKRSVARKVMDRAPATMRHAEAYTTEAMDIHNTVVEKMQGLTPLQFEGILRPAFQADEWILIAVGAALGLLVGLSQDVVLVPLFMGELF